MVPARRGWPLSSETFQTTHPCQKDCKGEDWERFYHTPTAQAPETCWQLCPFTGHRLQVRRLPMVPGAEPHDRNQRLQGLLDLDLSPGSASSRLAVEPQVNDTPSLGAAVVTIHRKVGRSRVLFWGHRENLWVVQPEGCLVHRDVLISQRGWCDCSSSCFRADFQHHAERGLHQITHQTFTPPLLCR